ncbi:MAG: hypothetical protein JXA11_10515 [Phycisphaerae bacterium]|nr:hypothetical protein [Phycisphaerae bacterium]
MLNYTQFPVARWSKTVVIVTVAVSVALCAESVLMFFIASIQGMEPWFRTVFILAGLIPPVILLTMFAFAPLSYRIEREELVVSRLARNYRVPLNKIASVRRGDAMDLRGSTRTMGCGGFAGFYGLFSVPALGKSRLFITRKDSLVILPLTQGRTLVLSPKDPEAFVKAIEEAGGKS